MKDRFKNCVRKQIDVQVIDHFGIAIGVKVH